VRNKVPRCPQGCDACRQMHPPGYSAASSRPRNIAPLAGTAVFSLLVAASGIAGCGAPPAIPDGRHSCMLVAVVRDPPQISLRLHEILHGDAADRAAREDGKLGPGEHVDNDYYVRTSKRGPLTLPLAGDVVVSLLPRVPPAYVEMSATSVAPSSFDNLLQYYPARGGACSSPYGVTAKAGVIVAIEEVYVP